MASPIVPSEGVLLGRARVPGFDHPRIVTVRGDNVVDITARAAPTSRDIAELSDPAAYVAGALLTLALPPFFVWPVIFLALPVFFH